METFWNIKDENFEIRFFLFLNSLDFALPCRTSPKCCSGGSSEIYQNGIRFKKKAGASAGAAKK